MTLYEYKKNLRAEARALRRLMDPAEKIRKDAAITDHFLAAEPYLRAKTILCYASLPSEVNTGSIIDAALAGGKRVAVPVCVPGTRRMDFCLIASREQLVPGSFGVPEPRPGECRKLEDFAGSLCVVPALYYDLRGYRLGYGGGYYDRFLGDYPGFRIGIVYDSCLLPRLRRGRFDVAVNAVVTEKGLRRTARPSRRYH
jgi:5-formyltetrahydrofolate cyclo-ligase